MSIFSQVSFNQKQASMDAGGIIRTGSQTTLFDGKELNIQNTQAWQTVGTGTETFQTNKTLMTVGVGEYVIRQTKRFFPYFSGKSQRVETTFDGFAPDANVIKRVGYFSSSATAPYDATYDGFYLESDGTTIRLKMDRAGTNVLDVAITSWSGYSQLGDYQTLATWDNFTVIEFKFLWLGGAVLIMSIVTDDGFIEAHRFSYAGTSQDVFMQSPNQPVRYEIRSSTGTGTFREICSQVATEGSIGEDGFGISLNNPTAITANSVGTHYVLMSVRKSATYRDVPIHLIDMQGIVTSVTADSGILMLVVNPTLSAPLSYSSVSRFEVAYGTGQTVTAGTGRVIANSGASSQGANPAVLDNNYLAYLSGNIDNTFDEYVLVYMPVTTNQSIYGVLNLKEY